MTFRKLINVVLDMLKERERTEPIKALSYADLDEITNKYFGPDVITRLYEQESLFWSWIMKDENARLSFLTQKDLNKGGTYRKYVRENR